MAENTAAFSSANEALFSFGDNPAWYKAGMILTKQELDNCLRVSGYKSTKMDTLVYRQLAHKQWIIVNLDTGFVVKFFESEAEALQYIDDLIHKFSACGGPAVALGQERPVVGQRRDVAALSVGASEPN